MRGRDEGFVTRLRDRAIGAISRWRETSDYSSAFENRKVVLIGPNSLMDDTDRARITGSDVCVVMNKGRRMAIFPQVQQLAKRIAYFHCLDPDERWGGGALDTAELRRAGFKELFFPLADVRMEPWVESFHRGNRGLVRLRRIDPRTYAEIERDLAGFRPTSGLAIASSLARIPGCTLYITGITFYRKAYMPEYSSHLLDLASIKRQMEGHGIHHPDREFIEFLRLKQLHHIEVDAQLDAILKAPYQPLFYTDPGDDRTVHDPAQVLA